MAVDHALAALVAAFEREPGPLGYRLTWTTRRTLAERPQLLSGLAEHPVRPMLRVMPNGAIQDDWRKQPFAPSAAAALARLMRVDALAEYSLVGDAKLVDDLVAALDLRADPLHADLWIGDAGAIEVSGERVFVSCREAAAVSRSFEASARSGRRLRLVDEHAEPSPDAPDAGGTELARLGDEGDGLRVARRGDELTQQRWARGQLVDHRVAAPRRTSWQPVTGRTCTGRVARWLAECRIAQVHALRRAAEVAPAAVAARAAGWTRWPNLLEALAGTVAVGEWGGVADAHQGPLPRLVFDRSDPFVTVAGTRLLPLGNFPFRGGDCYGDERGWIWSQPWIEAAQPVPFATTATSLFEKLALAASVREHPVATVPSIEVNARAGKDFWKRLPAQRDDPASDAISEHFLAAGLWVERGVGARDAPYVRVHLVPDALLVEIATRLARTTSGALLSVHLNAERGEERFKKLRDAGLAVRCV